LWHPLRVESVAWIAERKDVLAGTFWILGLSSYASYCQRPDLPRYALVCLMLLLGLMSKSMVVTLPFVFLLLDVWPLRRPGPPRLLEKAPMLAIVALVSWVTVFTQRGGGAISDAVGFSQRLANIPLAYLEYVTSFLWPTGLGVLYPHPALSNPEGIGPILPLFLGLLMVTASIVLWRRRASQPELYLGWFWFLGTLVPVIGLIQVGNQGHADRYMYLPAIGLSLALLAIPRTFGLLRKPGLLVLAASALALAFSARARHQVQFWRTSEALWERAIDVTEGNYIAHLNLGQILGGSGRVDEATEHFEEALRIRPGMFLASLNLGYAWLSRKEYGEARATLESSIESHPEEPLAHLYLSVALLGLDLKEQALLQLDIVEELDSEMVEHRLFKGTKKACEEEN